MPRRLFTPLCRLDRRPPAILQDTATTAVLLAIVDVDLDMLASINPPTKPPPPLRPTKPKGASPHCRQERIHFYDRIE